MNDIDKAKEQEINLPAFPGLQVPMIDADVDLVDIKKLSRWCERVAVNYATEAVRIDREGRYD